jgi:hypothetical protein
MTDDLSRDSGTPRAERLVMRASGGLWPTIVLAVVTILLAGDAVLRGRIDLALRILAVAALVFWFYWAVLIRPHIVATPATLTLVNVWATHVIPWQRISRLTSVYQLIVTLDDGRVIRSWGAPAAGPQRRRPGRGAGVAPSIDTTLNEWRDDHADPTAEAVAPVTHFERYVLVVTAVLLVLAILAFVL